ncbi:AgmX/PglI C-terminal domain-containing protein [Teredinibacter turnerae]|uniref:AgmX/PglI C-terminal domain-containing protein n=1 Tax=Teredinibacter turnerae TaxID=2426 RepID=UPI001E2D6E4E|nr:AgmX/PglI C-terminal domain-containing protein [Teredinibacter turnerae]
MEKKARDTAAQSGLLALGSELADLIDTSEVDTQLKGKLKSSAGSAAKAVGHGTEALLAGTEGGSGGVSEGDYVASVGGGGGISKHQVALVKQSLFKEDAEGNIVAAGATGNAKRERSGNVRSEEEITLTFDRNKGSLYSIYNRERRKKPGLKGKIVLELTISPEGVVTDARIVSSELDDPSLERRLLARVKMFKFEQSTVEPVTVVFPVEFLPS